MASSSGAHWRYAGSISLVWAVLALLLLLGNQCTQASANSGFGDFDKILSMLDREGFLDDTEKDTSPRVDIDDVSPRKNEEGDSDDKRGKPGKDADKPRKDEDGDNDKKTSGAVDDGDGDKKKEKKDKTKDELTELLSARSADADDDDSDSGMSDSEDVPTETPQSETSGSFYGSSSFYGSPSPSPSSSSSSPSSSSFYGASSDSSMYGFYGSSPESSESSSSHTSPHPHSPHHNPYLESSSTSDRHSPDHYSFYGVYGLHHVSSSDKTHEPVYKMDDSKLKVSFTLSVGSDGEYTQAEEEELKFRTSNSINEAATRLGIGRYLGDVYISISGESSNQTSPYETASLDFGVIFNQNSHGVYQFAQMLRENVIYVFPLDDYSDVEVSNVQVAPYSGIAAPAGGPLPEAPYAGRLSGPGPGVTMGKSGISEKDSAVYEPQQIPEPVPETGGCVLDRFSLNGVPSCCFAPFQLDARFECCKEPSGVDECGVCGGTGQTCAISFSTRVGIPAGADVSSSTSKDYTKLILQYQQGIALLLSQFNVISVDVDVTSTSPSIQGGVLRRLLQQPQEPQALLELKEQSVDVTAVVMPRSGVTLPTLSEAHSLFQQAAGEKAQYEELQFLAVMEVKRVGVCSNGVCEVGEMSDPLNPTSVSGTCPQDCPITKLCPMPVRPAVGLPMTPCASMGRCDEETGSCSCQPGYSGDACSMCEEGYYRHGYTCQPACPISPTSKILAVGEPSTMCSNRGRCNKDSGQCSCLEGYAGDDCSKCAENFVAQGRICVEMILDTMEVSQLDDGTSASRSSSHASLVIGIIISFAVVLVILAALLFIAIARQRRNASSGGNSNQLLSNSGQEPKQRPRGSITSLAHQINMLGSYSTTEPEQSDNKTDPDPPTRQDPTGVVGAETPIIQHAPAGGGPALPVRESPVLGLRSALPVRQSPSLDSSTPL